MKGAKLTEISLSATLSLELTKTTGESLPIPKLPLPKSNEIYSIKRFQKNSILEGTTIVKAKPGVGENKVLALVVRIGFSTFKGQIFRGILYPKPVVYPFFKSVIQLLVILALVFSLLFIWQVFGMVRLGFKTYIILSAVVNLVLTVIVPVLPIFVSTVIAAGNSSLPLRRYPPCLYVAPLPASTSLPSLSLPCSSLSLSRRKLSGRIFSSLLAVCGGRSVPEGAQVALCVGAIANVWRIALASTVSCSTSLLHSTSRK